MKAKRTAKQIATATKNILTYEKKDDSENMMRGFVIGASVVLLAAFIFMGL